MTEKVTKMTFSVAQEFVAFIKGFGVIGLALGVVIGNATNDLVKSLTTNVISPLITLVLNLILPNVTLAEFTLGGIGVGLFIDSLISFTILMFIIFVSVRLALSQILSEAERIKLGIGIPAKPAEPEVVETKEKKTSTIQK